MQVQRLNISRGQKRARFVGRVDCSRACNGRFPMTLLESGDSTCKIKNPNETIFMNVGLEIEDETYMHVGHVNDYALIVSIYLVRPLKRYGSYI